MAVMNRVDLMTSPKIIKLTCAGCEYQVAEAEGSMANLQYCPRCATKYAASTRREIMEPGPAPFRVPAPTPEQKQNLIKELGPWLEVFKSMGGSDMFTDYTLRKEVEALREQVRDLSGDVSFIGAAVSRVSKKVGA